MIDCKGALKALSVLTICQSKEDTIRGAVVGPLLGKGWSYERGDVSCQGRCVLSVKGDVSHLSREMCPVKRRTEFCSKVSSHLLLLGSSFPTCNSYPFLCPFHSFIGTRELHLISLSVNFGIGRSRLSLWNNINMEFVAFSSPRGTEKQPHRLQFGICRLIKRIQRP